MGKYIEVVKVIARSWEFGACCAVVVASIGIVVFEMLAASNAPVRVGCRGRRRLEMSGFDDRREGGCSFPLFTLGRR